MEKIEIGDYEVLESGCVTSIQNQDILFSLSDNIKIRIQFNSTDSKEQTMNLKLNDDSTELTVELSNFNNPLGTEFANAIEIGKFQGRKLSMHVKVIGMRDSMNRVVFYTFLLGGLINNG